MQNNYAFPVSASIQDAIVRSREDFNVIYTRWRTVGQQLATLRRDPRGHAYEYLDSNIDLILRSIEREQQSAHAIFDQKIDGGIFFFQISLSKMWLFATYEALRTAVSDSLCGAARRSADFCNADDCIRCKAQQVKKELAFFRVPLAKLEPEKYRSQMAEASRKNYHPQLLVDRDNGSVGWEAVSTRSEECRRSSRLALSDLVLAKLAPP